MAYRNWSPISSNLPTFNNAGDLAVNAAINLGQTFANTGKGISDLMSETAARDALQYLAASYDPNNPQSINQALPLALASNPNLSSNMLGYLSNDYRGAINKQLDLDNLALEKERVKAAQNAVDAAQANADINGLQRANRVLASLNARRDARSYGDRNALLDSQSLRAARAADIAAKRAAQDDLINNKKISGIAASIGEALTNIVPRDIDLNSIEGKEAVYNALEQLTKNVGNIKGITPEDAIKAKIGGLEYFKQLQSIGAAPNKDFANRGNLTASFRNPTTLEEVPFSWKYDLSSLLEEPTAPSNKVIYDFTDPSDEDDTSLTKADDVITQNTDSNTSKDPNDIPLTREERDRIAAKLEKDLIPSLLATDPQMQAYNINLQEKIAKLRSNEPITKNSLSGNTNTSTQPKVEKKPNKEEKALNTALSLDTRTKDALQELRESFKDNNLNSSSKLKKQQSLNKYRQLQQSIDSSVNTYINSRYSLNTDKTHASKAPLVFSAVLDEMLGISPNMFPAEILGIKDDKGNSLTQEQIQGIPEDDLFDMYANNRDWTTAERHTAKQEYAKAKEEILLSLDTGRNTVDSLKNAGLLALALVADANEFNSGITSFLGDNEDYQSGLVPGMAKRMANDIRNKDTSEIFKLRSKQRQQAAILNSMDEAAKSLDITTNVLKNIQKKVNREGYASPIDVQRVIKLKQQQELYQQAGYDAANALVQQYIKK